MKCKNIKHLLYNYKCNLAQHQRARGRLEKRHRTLFEKIREYDGSRCSVRQNIARIYTCDIRHIRQRIVHFVNKIYDCRKGIDDLIVMNPDLEEDSDDGGTVIQNQNRNDDVANLADVEDNEEEEEYVDEEVRLWMGLQDERKREEFYAEELKVWRDVIMDVDTDDENDQEDNQVDTNEEDDQENNEVNEDDEVDQPDQPNIVVNIESKYKNL